MLIYYFVYFILQIFETSKANWRCNFFQITKFLCLFFSFELILIDSPNLLLGLFVDTIEEFIACLLVLKYVSLQRELMMNLTLLYIGMRITTCLKHIEYSFNKIQCKIYWIYYCSIKNSNWKLCFVMVIFSQIIAILFLIKDWLFELHQILTNINYQ